MKEEDFNKNNFTCKFNCLNDPQSKGKIEKDFKRIAADYNQKGNAVVFDPDQIGVAELNT